MPDDKRRVPQPSHQAPHAGARILYIDDEEALVFLVKRMFEQVGYRVTAFSSGDAAIAAFAADPAAFDLVLTDLTIPGSSGIEIARRVLELRPQTPVVLATGAIDPRDVDRANEVGIRRVILKPTTIEEMAKIVGSVLDEVKGPGATPGGT